MSCSVKKLADVESVELTDDVSVFPSAPGIYAVYDKAGSLQYVGLSRRVSSSLQSHLRDLPELCATAKVREIDGARIYTKVREFEDWDVGCGVWVMATAVVEMLCVNVVELATKCGMHLNPLWSNFLLWKHPVLQMLLALS